MKPPWFWLKYAKRDLVQKASESEANIACVCAASRVVIAVVAVLYGCADTPGTAHPPPDVSMACKTDSDCTDNGRFPWMACVEEVCSE